MPLVEIRASLTEESGGTSTSDTSSSDDFDEDEDAKDSGSSE